jgi:hypothetical protein
MAREQGSSGELEKRLYKADVVPTSGDGAPVTFSDVQTLTQQSPNSPPVKKEKCFR